MCHKAYCQTDNKKLSNEKYRQSEEGKKANLKGVKKYQGTEKGKITKTKAQQKYVKTESGRDAVKKGSHKRRALKQGATVEDFSPTEIFERDGYRCQLCGIKTRYYKTKSHPNSPELDHIIPLSLGGEHSRLNTQCLCSHCNRVKHNTGVGDQIRMFGWFSLTFHMGFCKVVVRWIT